jgi:hypothetical protein
MPATPTPVISTPEVESARRAARSAIAILTPGNNFQQAENALAALILDCQADVIHEALRFYCRDLRCPDETIGHVMDFHNGLRRAALKLREPS